MEIPGWMALLVALAAAALAALAWLKAKDTAAVAADAKREAHDAKTMAHDARRIAGEASVSVKSGNQRALATARESAAAQAPSPQSEKTAHIVVRPGSTYGEDLPTNQGTGSGLLGIFLVNEGPAVARELRLRATFPNGATRGSEIHRTLSAQKELTLYAQVVPPDFGTDDTLHVLYQIAYQDGNGDQEIARTIRVEGGWKGPWKTFIEEQ
jgi:hypothetical protein